MGNTSSAVKRKYNAKAYRQWNVQLKPDMFQDLEAKRDKLAMSRAEFLAYLLKKAGE